MKVCGENIAKIGYWWIVYYGSYGLNVHRDLESQVNKYVVKKEVLPNDGWFRNGKATESYNKKSQGPVIVTDGCCMCGLVLGSHQHCQFKKMWWALEFWRLRNKWQEWLFFQIKQTCKLCFLSDRAISLMWGLRN